MNPTQKSHRIRLFPHRPPCALTCLRERMLQSAAGILLRRARCFSSCPGIWTCEPASEMEGLSPPPHNTHTAPLPLTVPPFAEARVSQKQKIKTDWGKRLSFSWSNTKVHPFFLKERGSWWAFPSDFMQLASITTLSHYLGIQTPTETFVFPLMELVEVFYTYTFAVCLWQHVWLPVIFAVSYTFARLTWLNQAYSSFPLPFHVFPFRN